MAANNEDVNPEVQKGKKKFGGLRRPQLDPDEHCGSGVKFVPTPTAEPAVLARPLMEAIRRPR
jgi:hypothetical protein